MEKRLLLNTNKEIMQKISTTVKHKRIQLNLRQEDLAQRANVSLGTVRNFERDTSTAISLNNLIEILRQLSMLDKLTGLIDE